jgi:toxin-antitoxin system PIN domain toxin
VILVDVNLLVYATNSLAPEHEAAREWLDDRLSDNERVALPWQSTLGFVRVATNSRLFSQPMTIAEAWEQVETWLAQDNVWVPVAGRQHQSILGSLLRNLGGGPRLVPDAHLAALAIEHGLKLCSCDGDFARFDGLRWENPLSETKRS